jgi:carbon-monoxide dehydrogenase small subunit
VRSVSLVINGRAVQAEVTPRLNLADFLREHQSLTATHVGCEHGVCGACTVLIDGAPARSCITFAAAADGAAITTLEGFEGDAAMDCLREAFAENHGLQCGFCTPGMLITAHDILTRLPDADEKRIRLELSGNLCRCTGYVGIVKAIQSAQQTVKAAGHVVPAAARRIGPVGAHRPSASRISSPRTSSSSGAKSIPTQRLPAENFDAIDWIAVAREGVELRQTFSVPYAQTEVWHFFANLDQVTRCMPGARLMTAAEGSRAEGEVSVKLGPIVSAFQGVLDVMRDESRHRGVVRGAGRDTKSASNARAIITYDVHAADVAASRIEVTVRFLLSGALAQFSRSGLVKDVADHLTGVFARNLEARLRGAPIASEATLDAGAAAGSAIWSRVRAFVRRLFGG